MTLHDDLLLFLLAALLVGAASASLSRLVSRERGFLNMFGAFRKWLRDHKEKGKLWAEAAEGFSCPICLGVWVSTVLTILAVVLMGLPWWTALLIAPTALGFDYALLGLSALWT